MNATDAAIVRATQAGLPLAPEPWRAVAEVNGIAGTHDVKADSPFAMQITDLIAMGGESNAFPKHFCYFLPEDEGAGFGKDGNKTILFRNVYGLRYEQIGALLDIEVGAVKVRVHRAMRQLRETFDRLGGHREAESKMEAQSEIEAQPGTESSLRSKR